MDKIEEFIGSRNVSVRTIAKHFKMKRNHVNRYLKLNDNLVKVDPVEVGSGKVSVNVWKRR